MTSTPPWNQEEEEEGTTMLQNTSSSNPDAAHRQIANSVGRASQETHHVEEDFFEIDYGKQYEEEVLHNKRQVEQAVEPPVPSVQETTHQGEVQHSMNTAFHTSALPAHIKTTHSQTNQEVSYQTSQQETQLPATRGTGELVNAAQLNQESILRHMAHISDENALIRNKIMENNAIIEQARKAEIENQALKEEYHQQDQLLQKLQHFHSLFDEYSEFLK